MSSIKIKCPHDGCKEEIGYEQYQTHVDQCQIITCFYCDVDYAKKDENIHRDNCANYWKFQKIELESDLASVKSEFAKYVTEIPKDGRLFPFLKESVRTNIIYY